VVQRDGGLHGVISVTNSLVGSTATDLVGNGGITVLPNGNYVVEVTIGTAAQ